MAIETYTIPALAGGWNGRDSLDAMPANHAVRLVNLFPDNTRVKIRGGYASSSTGAGTGPIETLVELVTGAGTTKRIACGSEAIYDVTTATAADITQGSFTITNNRWQAVQANGIIVLVNGSDQPQQWNGAAANTSDATYTGISDDADLVQGCLYRNRLYFVETGSQSIWYGGVSAVTGALTEFSVSYILHRGGSIAWVTSLSDSINKASTDALIICSENGEILVYSGDYPGNLFELTARIFVGRPLGRRSYFHRNNELFAICEDGLWSIPRLIAGQWGDAADVFAQIKRPWRQATKTYFSNAGWEGHYYPQGGYSFVNIPLVEFSDTTTGDTPDAVDDTAWLAIIEEFAAYEFDPATGYIAGLSTPADNDMGFFVTQYDVGLTMYNLAQITGDTATYYGYLNAALPWYRDEYLVDSSYVVPGYYNYPEGMATDYIERSTGDSLTGLQGLLASALFVNSNSCADAAGGDSYYQPLLGLSDGGSRECAYALRTFIWAELAGETLNATQTARRETLFEWCLDHIDQWVFDFTAPYYRAFMGGLTFQALRQYYDNVNADERIPIYIKALADYTWTMWNADDAAFYYTDRQTDDPNNSAVDRTTAVDLNMLIAPMFAWCWKQTGTALYRTRALEIFAGALPVYSGGSWVSGPYLGPRNNTTTSGKQINQQLYMAKMFFDDMNAAPTLTTTSTGSSEQYVINVSTNAPCQFKGQPASTFCVSGGDLYFGSNNGTVYKADTGYNDNDSSIEVDLQSSFNYHGRPNLNKHINAIKPLLQTNKDLELGVVVNTDFQDQPVANDIEIIGSTGLAWGSAWGSAWGPSHNLVSPWVATQAIGYAESVRLYGKLKNVELEVSGIQVRANVGGEL